MNTRLKLSLLLGLVMFVVACAPAPATNPTLAAPPSPVAATAAKPTVAPTAVPAAKSTGGGVPSPNNGTSQRPGPTPEAKPVPPAPIDWAGLSSAEKYVFWLQALASGNQGIYVTGGRWMSVDQMALDVNASMLRVRWGQKNEKDQDSMTWVVPEITADDDWCSTVFKTLLKKFGEDGVVKIPLNLRGTHVKVVGYIGNNDTQAAWWWFGFLKISCHGYIAKVEHKQIVILNLAQEVQNGLVAAGFGVAVAVTTAGILVIFPEGGIGLVTWTALRISAPATAAIVWVAAFPGQSPPW